MKRFDRPTFFDYVRRSPFGNRLAQRQVEGLESILAYAEKEHPSIDLRHLAYILATTFHETGGKMQPIREGFAKSDASARKILAKYPYAKPDVNTGHAYYGRGFVQLTWLENYARMGRLIGYDLVNNPDAAMDLDVALAILFEGMLRGDSTRGDFTGKSLEDYFNDTENDPVGARAIINGKDKAQLISNYHKAFLDSLVEARRVSQSSEPAKTPPEAAKPDGARLTTDKTIIGALTAGAGGAAASLIGAINNPWALVGFLVVAVGLFLVITGRIEIKKNSGA